MGCRVINDLLEPRVSSMEALSMLLEGNERFTSGNTCGKSFSLEELNTLYENGQSPIASIVACSDSRVSPEIIFDQGLGKMFVVRNAGNIIGKNEIESIEYSVEILNVPLIMVMGHNRCGAIETALDYSGGETAYNNIVTSIAPVIKKSCLNGNLPYDGIESEVEKENVHWGIEQLMQNPRIKTYTEKGLLKLIAAEYNLKTGLVSIL
jgi:carbonic anhydrase